MRHIKVLTLALVVAGCGVATVGTNTETPNQQGNDLVVLAGNTPRLARPEFDVGRTDVSLPMERMILSLQMSPQKHAQLEQLLAAQQDPASASYHQWLTPEDFGARFAPTRDELAQVSSWLSSQGFTIEEVGRSGMWINFTGSVSQVEQAFHTEIHNFQVNGALRHSNVSDPSVPRTLSSLLAGVVSLHNFPHKAMNTGLHPVPQLRPDYTGSSGNAISPGDFAIIYNVNPVYTAGVDGTGQTIAVVARTHPSATNWATFRTTMGLPANPPSVVVNGTDPGDLGADEDGEADLDAEWSGAIAKKATVKFVVSKSTSSTDGVDLSAQYIVNNNLAAVMTTSFGQCESTMGSTENTFFSNLWSQAASQGITAFVSSGDNGAAGCDDPSGSSASSGLAVSGLASTPYNVAVGGTQFNEGSGSYWNTTNAAGDISVLSYIPEVAWNESGSATCPSGDTCSGLWAGSGGKSSVYSKPSWQVCTGVPADGKRDLPDVSLNAAGHDGYLVETQGALYTIGGTSASSPSFASLMALIVQKTGARQGNANPRFYQLANAQYASGGTAVFHDTTSGSNSVPGLTGYSCTTGYDLATGLGSVDATALVNNWAGTPTPDFTLSASPTSVSAVQGSSGTTTLTTAVSGGFSNALTLSASGLPSGASASFSPATIAAPGAGTSILTLTAGSSTAVGTYTVTVSATGGSTTHTATVAFTVSAVPTPDFTLAASPASVSALQGSSGTTTVTTAVSGGFSNAIALSATGLPTGATAAFSPASIAAPGAGTSTLTLTAGASTTAGTYSVTVTGTGGSTTHTAIVSFTVTSSSGGTLLTDGFEGSGWTTAQVSGTAGAWTLAASGSQPSVSPHGGAKLADFNSYTSAAGSQTRLYQTTALPIASGYTSVTMTFWMYHDTGYPTDNDTVQAQVSTNGTTWTNVGSAVSRYNGSTGWAQATVDLTAYKGQTVQLGFLGVSAYGNDEYLDDLSVVASGSGPTTYTVSGTITLSGSGLSGVSVSAGSATATTNASGAFTLSGLANGSYTVTPSLSGYTFTPASQSVTVNGANVTGVTFTATAVVNTYSVSGTITLSGSGLSGVTVSAGSATATTNASGAFTIAGLANGSYTLTPSLAGYNFTPASQSVTVSGANVTGVAFTAASSGTTTLVTDGFEGSGWTTAQVSGTAGSWTLAASGTHPSITPHGGSKLAVFNSYTANAGNQTRLYQSTGFAIPSSASTVTLTFWMYHDTGYASDNDTVQAQVSTDGTTWTSVGSAVSRYSTTTGWAQASVDLSSYRGQTVRLGFLGASAYGNDEYVDDVSVVASGSGPTTYSVSGTITLSGSGLAGVTVSAGTASATTSASGAFTIAGLANGSYTLTPSLSGYTFSPASQAVTVSGANVTGVSFTATASGVTTLFSDGFESTGWTTAQVSGTAGSWTLVASGTHPSVSPHGGSKLADFNSYTSSSGSQTRLYRSTGFAVASSFASVTLKFWMYHDTGYASDADKVQVQVSTNGTTWTNVGTAATRYTGATGWTQSSVDLSAYKGQTVQVAFLGISAYGNDEYLDDVTVTAQ